MYDHESLVGAIKQVDVVISTVGYAQLNDQDRILAAIKEAGNVKVKRFDVIIHSENLGFFIISINLLCFR